MTVRLAVFDCDGTLVDSQANILRAMEECFSRARLDPPCRHATRRIVGLSLLETMQTLLPDADAALHRLLADDYKTAFQRLRASGDLAHEPLYPGVREGLGALEARGWLLGVATGKSDRGLSLCLTGHDIHPHFVTLQTADRHPSKPHPSMLHTAMADAGALSENTVMIGDTSFDMAMGVAAGARPIGVDWGYHEPDELRAAGAECVVARFEELIERLEAA
jgi:phosphoglycolate phosphatase